MQWVQKWVGIVLILGIFLSFFYENSANELPLDHHLNCLICLQMTTVASTFPIKIIPIFHIEECLHNMNKGTILELKFVALNQRSPPSLFS